MGDREKLIELIRDGVPCPDDGNPFEEERCASCRYYADVDCDFLRLADYLLANGVTVQKHGRWITGKREKDYWGFDEDGDFGCFSAFPVVCSNCRYDLTEHNSQESDFCPNCGAKMDLEG